MNCILKTVARVKTTSLRNFSASLLLFMCGSQLYAQQVDYSVAIVPEERGWTFEKVTNDNDYVCMPEVRRSSNGLTWWTNRILDISPDGKSLAYLSARNNTTNIFIKDVNKPIASVQRTNRANVIDFNYSPDGTKICFSETIGQTNQLFMTDASKGFICRQLTTGSQDYSPVFDKNMTQVFFTRQERNGSSIWSFTLNGNYMSSYMAGFNPCPLNNENAYLCSRTNQSGKPEIWKINYENETEECIVSDINRGFSTPAISPNGNWVVFVGESLIYTGSGYFHNTDIYVCHPDGSELTQITHHAADDLSPMWSSDGQYIYFVSQRGSNTGTANVWRVKFALY